MNKDSDHEEDQLIQELAEWNQNVVPGKFKVRDGFLVAFCAVLVGLTVFAFFNING